MKYAQEIICQSYLVRYSDTVKFEGKDRVEKTIKYNIIDFFVCKIYNNNTIYPN